MTVHVLLVEDNLVNQEVAMLMLNSFGCRVDVASNHKPCTRLTFNVAPAVQTMTLVNS